MGIEHFNQTLDQIAPRLHAITNWTDPVGPDKCPESSYSATYSIQPPIIINALFARSRKSRSYGRDMIRRPT